MKNAKTVLLGILVTAVALSALVAPAAAEKFVHPRGILIDTYPQQILVFWNGPGYVEKTLGVAIVPPWYFVEDLMGFDSVTLTITLANTCYAGCRHYGDPLTLLGADANGRLVIHWSAVTIAEEDNGAFLLCPITFVITASTGPGFYMLYLSAEAEANSATFRGWDQVPVSVSPAFFLG
jgi:hypothetical protein